MGRIIPSFRIAAVIEEEERWKLLKKYLPEFEHIVKSFKFIEYGCLKYKQFIYINYQNIYN